MTECKQLSLAFQPLGLRKVVEKFDAPAISSDGGGLLLREVEERLGFVWQFAQYFDDYRSPRCMKYKAAELLLQRILGAELQQAKQQFQQTGQATRLFKDLQYKTKKSWRQERRVIGKAEHLGKGSNPRFVVTSLTAEACDSATLYEQKYCARGEMENRIKEQQLYLFADRTSASTMRANQLRLWLSSVAYVLVNALREHGLRGTEFEKAQCHTIRQKLFKIGTEIRVTVRKVWVSISSAYPYAEVLQRVLSHLQQISLPARPPIWASG